MGRGAELPDFRSWSPRGTPLEDVQERLARRGLRDPWARDRFRSVRLTSNYIVIYAQMPEPVIALREPIPVPEHFCLLPLEGRPSGRVWSCNEAWRFSGGFAKPITFSNVFFRGFKWGFAAFVVALGVEYALSDPKKNGGHH